MRQDRCWEFPFRETSGVFSPEEYSRLAHSVQETVKSLRSDGSLVEFRFPDSKNEINLEASF